MILCVDPDQPEGAPEQSGSGTECSTIPLSLDSIGQIKVTHCLVELIARPKIPADRGHVARLEMSTGETRHVRLHTASALARSSMTRTDPGLSGHMGAVLLDSDGVQLVRDGQHWVFEFNGSRRGRWQSPDDAAMAAELEGAGCGRPGNLR